MIPKLDIERSSMTANIKFFPLGNADTVRIKMADGRMMLVDFANMGTDGESPPKKCDLAAELKRELMLDRRNHFDVVCITHTDTDHCKDFGEFFHLDHAAKYQGNGRVEIRELWVPAAAILETSLTGDALLVRAEARHRLKLGRGIKVFSRTSMLDGWLRDNGMTPDSVSHLLVDAGSTVPGFSADGPEGVEFFVHCPFGWRQNDNKVINRNQDSIVMQATFREGGADTKFLLASDVDHETLSIIVHITRKYKNQDRLRWDLLKLPHHCSYLSLGPEKGVNETVPEENVRWLMEDCREVGSIVVSPSWPIPVKGSAEDAQTDPPYRQAANYYRRTSRDCSGDFKVTMEEPTEARPRSFSYNVTAAGLALAVAAPMASSTASSTEVRAG